MQMRQPIKFTVSQSPLGSILVAVGKSGICAIFLGSDAAALTTELRDRFPGTALVEGDAGVDELAAKVRKLVETPGVESSLPLDVGGTSFQRQVWEALREIPAGTTATYTDIAARIGHPEAVRAVAQACGANLLAVAIPCHRVVRKDGNLSGYRWGVERKRQLLLRESIS